MDVRLKSNKKDVPASQFIIDRDNQEVKCELVSHEASDRNERSCPEFEIRFCCEKNKNDVEWVSSPEEYGDVIGTKYPDLII